MNMLRYETGVSRYFSSKRIIALVAFLSCAGVVTLQAQESSLGKKVLKLASTLLDKGVDRLVSDRETATMATNVAIMARKVEVDERNFGPGVIEHPEKEWGDRGRCHHRTRDENLAHIDTCPECNRLYNDLIRGTSVPQRPLQQSARPGSRFPTAWNVAGGQYLLRGPYLHRAIGGTMGPAEGILQRTPAGYVAVGFNSAVYRATPIQ